MVTINQFQIAADALSIDLVAETNISNTINKILFWDINTYRNPEQAIDLSYLLDDLIPSSSIDIDIPATEVGLNAFSGIYFIEVYSDEDIIPDDCVSNSNMAFGITANLTLLHECILNKVLQLKIDNCKIEENPCCDSCGYSVNYLNTLLETLMRIIPQGYYEEAIRIYKLLLECCDICYECPPYGDTLIINNTGFGTINNAIILI